MKSPNFPLLLILLVAGRLPAGVVISEIMFRPASDLNAEEFIEIHNTGPVATDVSSWSFTSGVAFTIPASTSIPAGGRLVVAADAAAFSTKYPGVANFVAGWTGILSNSSNKITLVDDLGVKMDEVNYSDDGDWGVRRMDWWSNYGHKGLSWDTGADGGNDTPPYSNAPADVLGKSRSLELVNAAFDNSTGQNWLASLAPDGTPGAANSVAASDIAPVIRNVSHFPAVPKSNDPVFVTALTNDDLGAAITVRAYWRVDGGGAFSFETMADDGLHGDTLAGDGIYGASLPMQTGGTIVEFYISASDGVLARTWPAPVLGDDTALTPQQTANCLYQVDDTAYAGAMPIYRLIMKEADKTELANINGNAGTRPYPYYTGETADQTMSHARFNASFVCVDGTGSDLRYRVGARNRGNGSRSKLPQGLNLMFPNDDPWNGATQYNLNSQYTPWQVFGAVIFAQAGVPAPQSRAVQVRWNATNPAGSGSPSYGFYACNEAWNSDLIDHRFPNDSSGNLYKGMRGFQGTTTGGTSIPNGAEFNQIVPGPTETKTLVELFKLNYKKQTNTAEDSWTDLIALTDVLAKGHSGTLYTDPVTWDADYATAVRAVADVEEWMRWFAANTMVDNNETNLSNGDGDDFNFYFGVADPRCKLMPYDLDTIFGGGDTEGSTTAGLFRMIPRNSSTSPNAPTPMNAFMKHPEFSPLYYAALKNLLDGSFKPANFDPLVQQTLGGLVNQSVIDSMKTFNAARNTYVAGQIPLAITVTTFPTVTSGYPRSTTATTTLGGKANAITTRSVKVNGVAATWTPWNATWSATGVALKPGINRVLIQAFDGSGNETERSLFDVWYDDSSVATVATNITTDTTWTAAGGPWQVTASISVAAGATLMIEPGASVYLSGGATLTVASGGRLLAEGSDANRIRFNIAPGSGATWTGIVINGTAESPESRISYARIDGNTGTSIDVNGGDVVFDHLEFGNLTKTYLSLDGASFVISDCDFPAPTAAIEPIHGTIGVKAGGRGIIRHCWFGVTNGYSDVIDFTGGQRPAPILQVIDNVFAGSGDDILDLDGTDAWIEGNIFLHTHKNGSPDSASAVSGGSYGSETSEVTIIGNLFYDVDQALTAKQGNYYTFYNNTVVRQTKTGGDDTEAGVVNLGDEGTTYGAGVYAEANILSDCEELVRNYSPADSVVTFNNNLMNLPWSGPGAGNVSAEPLFQHLPTMAETTFTSWSAAQVMKQWLSLKSGSPARSTGPNGRDKGGVITHGVCLSANVPTVTNLTAASISVGPVPSAVPTWSSGYLVYRWRIDGGAWSAETPITTPITLTGLTAGTHTVEVAGRNDADHWQDDVVFGPAATVASFTWTIDPGYVPPGVAPLVRINELLAKNAETLGYSGTYPDLIELHNAGNAPATLDGWGLTDDAAVPYKYPIPAGTTLAAGAYMVIHSSSAAVVPAPKTGFGLKDQGDTLTLTKSPADGGGVADSVAFGNQLSDHSIGRRPADGAWDLCRPSFGTANIIAAQGDPRVILINEWLAGDGALSTTDFIELFNPGTLPVNIGGGYLTDNPVGWPDRHLIRQLTFIGTSGYALFKADGDTNQGPDHLSFSLSASQGEIGLFTGDSALIDSIVYGPQSTDVSQGRTPNGGSAITLFTQPTPGGPNPGTTGGQVGAQTMTIIPNTASWRFNQSGTDLSSGFYAHNPSFDYSSWSGPDGALLYVEGSSLPWPKTKTLLLGKSTYYFRHDFNFAGVPAGATHLNLRLTACVDDGCIVYLNGTEVCRLGMAAGAATYNTWANRTVDNAVLEYVELPESAVDLLQPTNNILAVEVHQASSGSTDVVWGCELKLDYTPPPSVAADLRLNEISAIPETGAGWVELVNPGASPFDLANVSLTDDPSIPRKFIFPAGVSLPVGGRFVTSCDPALPASASNTGFKLGGIGGGFFVFNKPETGGGLLDSVTYGNQLAGYSAGRVPDSTGTWALCLPTTNALNTAAATGALTNVRINEWLASPASGADWFELFNPGSSPVLLGGNYLTDALTNKNKHLIAPLTFIGAEGWLQFVADSNSSLPGHVNFALSGSGEQLGVYTSSGIALDALAFGAQTAGVSQGRFPDGATSILTMLPTPAALNTVLDTDADGMPDFWENANGLASGSSADADLDADHDGMTNLQEYLAGTDPQDAASRFTNAITRDGGVPSVRFTARAGRGYTVQYSNTLGSWSKLADVAPQPVTAEVAVADPSAVGQNKRFYRILTPPVP